LHIFCDFDGTISSKDTTDEMLSQFAPKEWEAIEEEWRSGAIGSSECMKRQIALIRAHQDDLDAALDCQSIDPTFPAFVSFCQALNLPVTIISDGVDYFIRRILARHHLQHLPVIANHLTTIDAQSYALSSPYSNAKCEFAAGVCKCQQVDTHADTSIFIGDGRSDFCAVTKADLIFAKSTLAIYCEQQSIPYFAYHNFSDIIQSFKRDLPNIMDSNTSMPEYAFT
jgi:2-hydroxy-3-keto-5-methylthiopentenyl-1-phosphate phosphatase